MAAGGAEGEQAEQLLARSIKKGRTLLGTIVKAAVQRKLKYGRGALLSARDLFDPHERQALTQVLAAVNGTAELLGRARVRGRLEGGQFAEWAAFAGVEPLPPERAVAAFKKRVPTLPTAPDAYAKVQKGKAFTLAVATEKGLLDRIKGIITRGLAEGADTGSLTRQVQDVLDAAGVSARNPQYAEMVCRTAVLSSLNRGQMEEMQDPEVRDQFPVWRYDGIDDQRAGDDHRPHFGQYYPNGVPFEQVRGPRVFNCRCAPVAISADEWAELQAAGVKVAPGYERYMPKATPPAKDRKPKPPPVVVVPPLEVQAPAPGYGDPGKEHPLAGKSRQDQIRELNRVRDEGADAGLSMTKGAPKDLDVPAFARDLTAEVQEWARTHGGVGAGLDEFYARLGPKYSLTKEQFRQAVGAVHQSGTVRLSSWPKSTDELPDPELAGSVGSRIMWYVQPGERTPPPVP